MNTSLPAPDLQYMRSFACLMVASDSPGMILFRRTPSLVFLRSKAAAASAFLFLRCLYFLMLSTLMSRALDSSAGLTSWTADNERTKPCFEEFLVCVANTVAIALAVLVWAATFGSSVLPFRV